jgi:hypothetical protein
MSRFLHEIAAVDREPENLLKRRLLEGIFVIALARLFIDGGFSAFF